jgi:hypothetical protein
VGESAWGGGFFLVVVVVCVWVGVGGITRPNVASEAKSNVQSMLLDTYQR